MTTEEWTGSRAATQAFVIYNKASGLLVLGSDDRPLVFVSREAAEGHRCEAFCDLGKRYGVHTA